MKTVMSGPGRGIIMISFSEHAIQVSVIVLQVSTRAFHSKFSFMLKSAAYYLYYSSSISGPNHHTGVRLVQREPTGKKVRCWMLNTSECFAGSMDEVPGGEGS